MVKVIDGCIGLVSGCSFMGSRLDFMQVELWDRELNDISVVFDRKVAFFQLF